MKSVTTAQSAKVPRYAQCEERMWDLSNTYTIPDYTGDALCSSFCAEEFEEQERADYYDEDEQGDEQDDEERL